MPVVFLNFKVPIGLESNFSGAAAGSSISGNPTGRTRSRNFEFSGFPRGNESGIYTVVVRYNVEEDCKSYTSAVKQKSPLCASGTHCYDPQRISDQRSGPGLNIVPLMTVC
ncbi:hypothetical protein TNCV_4752901 [Trichonephila clavipes]|nr:hypothetical protein TNCV_4752901 [Trichonephila clavipes]